MTFNLFSIHKLQKSSFVSGDLEYTIFWHNILYNINFELSYSCELMMTVEYFAQKAGEDFENLCLTLLRG